MKKLKPRRLSSTDILITLVALEVMAYFYFGIRTVILVGLCMAVSFLSDWLTVKLMKKEYSAEDLICLADGTAIALMMPASIDYKIPVISCIFAVVIGKNLFGGRKNIIFSPCAIGYLFAVTSWKDDVLMYPEISSKLGIYNNDAELSRSLSYTFNTTGQVKVTDFEILLGNFEGAMGTVSILLLGVIAVVLIFRKAISTGAFAGVMSGLIFMSFVCPVTDSRTESLKYVLATNMFLFATIYIVSDKRTAPLKNYYSFFYGLFTALISYILLLTTGKENLIVTVSVLMTPLALVLKEIQSHIDSYILEENAEKASAESISETVSEEVVETVEEAENQEIDEESSESDEENNDESIDDEINLIAEQGIAEISNISDEFSEWYKDDEWEYDEIYKMMPKECEANE